jgi:single-stranded-DNA-specific exonuclease
MVMMNNVWETRCNAGESLPEDLPALAERLEISPFLAALLWKRGICGLKNMGWFLDPGLRFLPALKDWPGLLDTAAFIGRAVLEGKKLVVWGDYDVDGITSSVLVADFFRLHGFTIRVHIPDRLGEGYGLNNPDLEMLAAEKADLLLTVDCGITNFAEIKRAKELGLTVIISDHHLPEATLPEADRICATTVGQCPCPHLAGVGVAFMLMAGVNQFFADQGRQKIDIRPLLDLVALGTLADVSDLSGVNRILVKNGLLVLAEARRPGISALKTSCNKAANAALTTEQVIFNLAPRINAAGRMGHSEVALQLLLTQDRSVAASCARELEVLNTERRSTEDSITQEAREQAKRFVQSGSAGLVLYQPQWHVGVIGIVASRMVEEFQRPTIILCNSHENIKGSGRSVAGFDLHAALGDCADLFIGYGGHKMAAGLSINYENLTLFRERFDETVRKTLGNKATPQKIKIDGELSMPESIDLTMIKELELLQPFGPGNEAPVFVSPPLYVREARKLGQSLYILDVVDKQSGLSAKAKIWRSKTDQPFSSKGRLVRLAYFPGIDRYNGPDNVELQVKDWILME